MGSGVATVRCSLLLALLLLLASGILAEDTVTGCGQPDCLRCGDDNQCTSCARAIVLGTRQCVTGCPGNYRLVHSDVDGYHGLLCRAPRFLDTADMTGGELAVLVAALVGAAICIGLVVGAFLFLRVRRKMDPLNDRLEARGVDAGTVNDLERIQFLTRLQALRPETQNFLEMLNDTRKKFDSKSGKRRDSTVDTKNRAYRSILRDLSRILTLLNRKEEQICTVPADWQRLLGWAERLLKRYKRQKISKEFGSAPHIEYLAVPTAHAPSSRPRSAAGRLSRPESSLVTGSHFSISQAIIEEEDHLDGAQSLPPIGAGEKRNRPAPPRGGTKYRKREAAGRAHNCSVPTGLHLLPEECAGKPVFVHQLNGGHGDLFVDEGWSRPADWPLEKLKHVRSARVERERTSDFTDTTTDGQSGHSGGSSAGLPPPPPPVYGGPRSKLQLDSSFNEHSDYIDKDIDSFSGRYFHEEELSTVL
ncbi:uncharacterized protein LOC119114051 [Pollicipes pollicipes]|uniref:uncharacterized protein LOC119114051 n=1 Tax=Pollicipes pollicipes TaxID=41117 RepID=UPI0018856097|nr:uncharacterized protein LOC119114051 [Pollicipes pollicipes]